MPQHFPSAIALGGAIALSVISGACASTRSAPSPFPMPRPPVVSGPAGPASTDVNPVSPPLSAGGVTGVLLRAALQLRGVPYRNGGSDVRGFDCSGFTQYVFAQVGMALPRETREQFQVGTAVKPGEQQPGDLLFFTTTAPGASHVGIALGGEAFVHAPSSRGVVRIETLDLPYWSSRLIGIRRIETN